jgi:tetratricopeptide (TPR) repeat protein
MTPIAWLSDPRLWRWGLAGLGGLALVALLGAAGWAWHSAQQSRGQAALAEALVLVQQAQAPGAPKEARDSAMRALEAVITEHSRLALLPQAAYRLGNLRYEAGQYTGARGAYEITLAQGASGTLRTLAALGVGYTWEAEKEYAKAQSAYEAALRGLTAQDFLYEELLVDLGRVQDLAGNRTAALATYQRLLKDLPESPRADEVRMRLAMLQGPAAR